MWTKISSLEIAIFCLKIVIKSGREKIFFLKFTEPLQSCCCPVQKNLPSKAELAGQVSLKVNFRIKCSIPLFTIILCQKCQFQDSRFYRTYRMSPSWFAYGHKVTNKGIKN